MATTRTPAAKAKAAAKAQPEADVPVEEQTQIPAADVTPDAPEADTEQAPEPPAADADAKGSPDASTEGAAADEGQADDGQDAAADEPAAEDVPEQDPGDELPPEGEYTVRQFLDDPRFVDEWNPPKPHDLVGAFHDAELSDDDTLTPEEAAKHLAEYLERPVKSDQEA